MITVIRMRTDHIENPLGIDEARPCLAWALESDQANLVQTGYQIQVTACLDSLGPDFTQPVWDSRTVSTNQCLGILYDGPALKSRTRYWWRVMASTNQQPGLVTSPVAWFETGILTPAEWQARFITAETQPQPGKSSAVTCLRKDFSVDEDIVSARLYATALGLYEIGLNDQRVGDWLFTPGWTSYENRLLYQTYDVTNIVKRGANTLDASLAPGWYKGDLAWKKQRNFYGKQTALLAQLHIRFADGREEIVATDTSWQGADSPTLFAELYHGEIHDARRQAADRRPVKTVSFPLGRLRAQDGVPVRRQEVLKPVAFHTTPRGEKVLDFGQNLSGWVRFKVQGLSGDRVVLNHAEVLDSKGNFYTKNLRTARCTLDYTLVGGSVEQYEPRFTSMGFRYVQVVEWPVEVKPEDFEAVVIHSDMEVTGEFECSHPLLNQLHHNILWGMKGNFLDVPTDCPQRNERLGWTGDAQVFARTASFLMDTAPFYRKWLRDLAADQLPDGGVPFVVPDVLATVAQREKKFKNHHSATGWGDAAVILPWTMWICYGDKKVLEEQYPSMKAWVDCIHGHTGDGLIWNTGFHFGDWVALDAKEGSYFGATPNDLTATAFFAHSTRLLADTAAVLGKSVDEKHYRSLHEAIVAAFQEEFLTPRGRLAARTQTAHILALQFDLVQASTKPRTIATLLSLLEENDGHLVTGFLGTPYFCEALSGNGQTQAAWNLLLKEDFPSWLYQVKAGATTIWEHWDGLKPDGTMWSAQMNSFNHYAYGSIGEWLYRVAAGLDFDPSAPAGQLLVFHPHPGGGLTHARAACRTPLGRTSIAWKIEDGHMSIEVEVPPNATARLVLPFEVTGVPGQATSFGSGKHRFSYEVAYLSNLTPG